MVCAALSYSAVEIWRFDLRRGEDLWIMSCCFVDNWRFDLRRGEDLQHNELRRSGDLA